MDRPRADRAGPVRARTGGDRPRRSHGADTIAGSVADRLGWPVEAHPADWRRYGKSAGFKRNLAMLDTHPILVIAFTMIPGGTPGTRHTLTNAYRRGIPVVVVTPDGRCSSTS
jgi:hypothetical protein